MSIPKEYTAIIFQVYLPKENKLDSFIELSSFIILIDFGELSFEENDNDASCSSIMLSFIETLP